jgi:DNA-binding CsgD family transcriptional regulator
VVRTWPLVGRADELAEVLDALRNGRGVVLSGQAGVGKSRLADELRAVARGAGWQVVPLTAGPENEAVPFATFLPLLEHDTAGDAASRLLRAARALTSKGDRVVVVVDDAHLLDEVSLAFVRHLLSATDVRVVVTIRSGELVPSTLVSLWRSDVLTRIEVLPLARDETEELLARALDGVVDGRVARWVWQTARGNPLFVRELVLDALDSGALVRNAGRWTLAPGVSPAGTRLREIIAARVGTLTGDERAAVELVALGEPLGLDTLASFVGVDVIRRMEERSLLAARSDRRRTWVRLAHPLHGEVVRATLGAVATRERLAQLVAAVESAGSRRREDALRVALWRAEMGDVGDWRSLLAAAIELANAAKWGVIGEVAGVRSEDSGVPRRHLEQAVMLARAALDGGRSAEAAAVLIRLLSQLGRVDEARLLYETIGALVRDGEDALAVARVRSEVLQFSIGDPSAAVAVLDEFAQRATEPQHRLAAVASRAALRMLHGAATEAIQSGEEVLGDERARREDVLLAGAAVSAAFGDTGHPVRGMELVDKLLASATAEDRMDLLGMLVVVRVVLLVFVPRLDEAEELASRCRDIAAAGGDDNAMGVFDIALANIAVARGDMVTARLLAVDAMRRVADDDPYGVVRSAVSVQVLASALLGDVDAAHRSLEMLDRHPPNPSFFGSDEIRARAWLDVVEGRATNAAARLQAGAEAMGAAGRWLREATLLHDLVRLGHARHAAHRLESIARVADCALARLFARHGAAADSADPARLLKVSADWEDAGFLLFAAEAAAQQAAIHTQTGDNAGAATAASRSRALAARCPQVTTPTLSLAGPAATLTKREREIAMLAATGMSDRTIADALVLSIRTVNAHLYNAYSKLGIDSRVELASVLGL